MDLQTGSSARQISNDSDENNVDRATSPVPPSSMNVTAESATASTTSLSPTNSTSLSPSPTGSSNSRGSTAGAVVGIVIGILVVFSFFLGFLLCRRARIRHQDPTYVPTQYLKNAWLRWEPRSKHDRLRSLDNAERHQSGSDTSRDGSTTHVPISMITNTGNRDSTAPATAGVDRNTSIRSIMTLPAYNPDVLPHEKIIGREGDRAGIDTVIEFPETVEEDEMRREQEMEALYQKKGERGEGRKEEVKEGGSGSRRLRGIEGIAESSQGESDASGSGNRSIDELRAERELIREERRRAVSSVSYADLGVARHDGTRLRGNSDEVEREGLLGDAASFASSHYHRRDPSNSSTISIDTMDLSSPANRMRGNSQSGTPLRNVTDTIEDEERAGSSPEMIDRDEIPPHSPPGYENITQDDANSGHPNGLPPGYTSPVQSRGNSLREGSSGENEISRGSQRALAETGMKPNNPPSRQSSSRSFASAGVQSSIPRLPSLRLGGLPQIHVDLTCPSAKNSGNMPLEESENEDRTNLRQAHPET